MSDFDQNMQDIWDIPFEPSTGNETAVTTNEIEEQAEEVEEGDNQSQVAKGSAKTRHARTQRIADYDPTAKYPTLPDPWVGYSFPRGIKFNTYGELDHATYSAADLQQFVLNHPKTDENNLILWIQKAPADASRRYPSLGSNKCRFERCPAGRWANLIATGWLRVAMDNRWTKYNQEQDPYHVAGYVHLYCLEKFLNFPHICKYADVRADDRDLLSREPNAKFAASLGKASPMTNEINEFLDAIRDGSFATKFPEYPQHVNPKLYHGTLSHRLIKTKIENLTQSKRTMYENRGIKDSNEPKHLGDLERFINAKQEGSQRRRGASRSQSQGVLGKRTASQSSPEEAMGNDYLSMGGISTNTAPDHSIDPRHPKKIKETNTRAGAHRGGDFERSSMFGQETATSQSWPIPQTFTNFQGQLPSQESVLQTPSESSIATSLASDFYPINAGGPSQSTTPAITVTNPTPIAPTNPAAHEDGHLFGPHENIYQDYDNHPSVGNAPANFSGRLQPPTWQGAQSQYPTQSVQPQATQYPYPNVPQSETLCPPWLPYPVQNTQPQPQQPLQPLQPLKPQQQQQHPPQQTSNITERDPFSNLNPPATQETSPEHPLFPGPWNLSPEEINFIHTSAATEPQEQGEHPSQNQDQSHSQGQDQISGNDNDNTGPDIDYSEFLNDPDELPDMFAPQ